MNRFSFLVSAYRVVRKIVTDLGLRMSEEQDLVDFASSKISA